MYYNNVGKPYDINTIPTSFYPKGGIVPDINKTGEIKKEEVKWQVGGYVRFLIDYGGHKKGTIGKITRISPQTINVNLPYYQTTDDCCLVSNEFEWLGMEDPIIGTKVLIDYYVADDTFIGQPFLGAYPKTPKESVKKGFDEAAYKNSPINQLIKLNIKKPKKVKIRL